MSNDFHRAHEAYIGMREVGTLLLDMRVVENVIAYGTGGAIAAECVADGAFYDGKGTAVALRAILGSILQPGVVAQPNDGATLPISLAPCSDLDIRRGGRILSMVHELHKAGYQKLRICAGLSVDMSEWRCLILTADNVRSDGWTPISYASGHEYSLVHGKRFFGWEDADSDDARRLAKKFIERFPETARAAAGQDWPYVGWFCTILGAAENGRLPTFYAGVDLTQPEPATSYPPPPSGSSKSFSSEVTGQTIVPHANLTLNHLPPVEADYEHLWPFCLSYDGYRGGLRTTGDCAAIADQTDRDELENATIEKLRVTAFIRQRAIKWSDQWPPEPRLIAAIRSVVEEIRRRLNRNEILR
jgi:hypothetical protein